MRACVALVSMPMGICISRRKARGIEIASRVALGWNEPAEPKKRVRRRRGNGGRAGQVEAGRQVRARGAVLSSCGSGIR